MSLHTSGRWRIAFSDEAVRERPCLVPPTRDRAWEVWDEPSPVVSGVVAAVQLIFPTSELALRPEQRATPTWKNIIFIEAARAGSGDVVAVTIFIASGDIAVMAGSGPSVRLALLPLPGDRSVQLVAHLEPELDIHELLEQSRRAAIAQAESRATELPPTAYAYFWGQRETGTRFLVGARVFPDPIGQPSPTEDSVAPLATSSQL